MTSDVTAWEELREAVGVHGRGFISGWRKGQPTETALGDRAKVLQLPGVESVQILSPKDKKDSTPNVYSGVFGLDSFPLHTDLAHWFRPPRYLALRLVSGGGRVATRVADGRELIDSIGSDRLAGAIVQPRRPIANRRPLMRLLERIPGPGFLLRWDEVFLVPGSPRSASVFARVGDALSTMDVGEVTWSEPGDTLVIDNWRMLHGRAPVPPEARNRIIERVYLGELH